MAEFTKGEWKRDGNSIQVLGHGCICITPKVEDGGVFERIANANLIVSAVNACISVNPDNPQAVAESIKDMYEALKKVFARQEVENGRVVMRATPSHEEILEMQQALTKAKGR